MHGALWGSLPQGSGGSLTALRGQANTIDPILPSYSILFCRKGAGTPFVQMTTPGYDNRWSCGSDSFGYRCSIGLKWISRNVKQCFSTGPSIQVAYGGYTPGVGYSWKPGVNIGLSSYEVSDAHNFTNERFGGWDFPSGIYTIVGERNPYTFGVRCVTDSGAEVTSSVTVQ